MDACGVLLASLEEQGDGQRRVVHLGAMTLHPCGVPPQHPDELPPPVLVVLADDAELFRPASRVHV
jgi:hypothetical protein